MRKLTFLASLLLLITVASSAHAATLTYNVVATFYEPETQPNNSIFTGSFDFDASTQTVSNLRGWLTESMTGMGGMGGGMMNEIYLSHQLDVRAAPGGLLVTTFLNDSTDTFTTAYGGDGWSPGTGFGLYYGFPGPNPGNAYAMIFINTTDPLTQLSQAQIDLLAYADCAPGGMMSATCMTGTSVAGYQTVGTMGGYPSSQLVTLAVPEPGTAILMLLGLVGLRAGRSRLG